MAESKSATPTRRRALAALASAAVAAPATAIASNPDAELQRLYDEVLRMDSVIERASEEEEKAHERAKRHYPPEPDMYAGTGWTREEIEHRTIADIRDLNEQQRELLAANAETWQRWKRECDRIDTEHGCDAAEQASGDAMDRQRELFDQMQETPARTARGMLLKLSIAVRLDCRPPQCFTGEAVGSVMADLQAIAGQGGDHAA